MTRAQRNACLLLCLLPLCGQAQEDTLGALIRTDFRQHYSAQPLLDVAVGFAVAGVLANSDADEEVQRVFRNKLQGKAGDSMAELFTDVGDLAQPVFSIPIYLAATWLGDGESTTARWGSNALRASLIGTPQLVALAYVSGGQRPEEGPPGWNPFDDNNGVSGHAFYGAVPLMTAAHISERRWLKASLYAASALPGLARIYDDKHYASQAFMGWWLAFVATRTVRHTNAGRASQARIAPLLYPDGGGLQFGVRF